MRDAQELAAELLDGLLFEAELAGAQWTGARGGAEVDDRRRVDGKRPVGGAADGLRGEALAIVEIALQLVARLHRFVGAIEARDEHDEQHREEPNIHKAGREEHDYALPHSLDLCYRRGMPRMHRLGLAALTVLLLGAGAPEEPAPTRLPPLRTVDGRKLLLLGAVNKKVGDATALWGFYVDEVDAKRAFPPLAARAGGRDRARLLAGDHASTYVTWGAFTKILHIRLDGAAAPSALQPWLKELLVHELADKSPDVQKAAQSLVALFDSTTPLDAGEAIVLRTTPEGQISVEIGGQPGEGPQSPRLVRALWSSIFNERAPADLRKGLVEGIDRLAH